MEIPFRKRTEKKFTAAARSSCPPTIAGLVIVPGLFEATGGGLTAAGTGGLPEPGLAPPIDGFTGFALTGGGLGFVATGGGTLLPIFIGAFIFSTEPDPGWVGAEDFFQGVADPFTDPIPGNTGVGLEDTSAVAAATGMTLGVVIGRVRGGGGGMAAGATFGGTNSR